MVKLAADCVGCMFNVMDVKASDNENSDIFDHSKIDSLASEILSSGSKGPQSSSCYTTDQDTSEHCFSKTKKKKLRLPTRNGQDPGAKLMLHKSNSTAVAPVLNF